jgi:hypothetical protein
MAEASLLITWGNNVAGRETMGLGVFQQALGYAEKQKQGKKLEDYRVGIANTGAIQTTSGYLIYEGTEAQIGAVLDDQEFKTIVLKAFHVVTNINIARCGTGTAIPSRIEQLLAVRAELGIK